MAEIVVNLPPLAGGQAESWAALIELAPTLADNWLLVGGQMVFLHEVERDAIDVRPTIDVDVVVDLRAEPTALTRVHETLRSAGFQQDPPSPDGAAHRYRRGAATLDVLAPDNIGSRAKLDLGHGRTIEAPGTTQAFRRSGTITVEVDGASAEIRRPELIGALIGRRPPSPKSPHSRQPAERNTFETSTHSPGYSGQMIGTQPTSAAASDGCWAASSSCQIFPTSQPLRFGSLSPPVEAASASPSA